VPRSANKSRKLGSACAAGIAALAVAAWQLIDVLLLAFAAVLIAVVFRALADVIERYSPLTSRWSLGAAILLVLLLTVDGRVLFGTQISNEVADLVGRLPFAWQTVEDRIGQGWLRAALQRVGNAVSTGGNIVEGPRARGSGPATGR